MKLYLSSYRLGSRFGELRRELRGNAKVAVVSNALDYISPDKRAGYRGFNVTAAFRESGLDALISISGYSSTEQKNWTACSAIRAWCGLSVEIPLSCDARCGKVVSMGYSFNA